MPADALDGSRIPGDRDFWVFIVADLFTFATLFAFFVTERARAPALFEAGRRELSMLLGLTNTLVLLTSGALMAGAVQSARRCEWEHARRGLWSALAVGALFPAIKAGEWYGETSYGFFPNTNLFFTFYFVLTGIHLFHVAIGVAILCALLRVSRSAKTAHEDKLRWIEAGGVYWHMVDLLWLALFAMLYLIPAA